MRRAIVSVTNDIATDQRVFRTCMVLKDHGYEILVVGRMLPGSPSPGFPWKIHRFRLLFNRKFAFYAEYNLRLFFLLLFSRSSLLWSNDLDTLLPNFLVSRLRGKKLIYDSHEYFCHVPELINRPLVRKIWLWIEGRIFPGLKHVITVNESIASRYEEEYRKRPLVIRNITIGRKAEEALGEKSPLPFALPEKAFCILQGAGINADRGAEEAILSMHHQDAADLVILGGGDALDSLKELVKKEKLEKRVLFIPKQPYDVMLRITARAIAGLSLDKPNNPNYLYSLPNKIFDYIHAGIPVLASPLPEVSRIVTGYGIGLTVENHKPETIADAIETMARTEELRDLWRQNLELAREELRWEKERKALDRLLEKMDAGAVAGNVAINRDDT